MNLYYIHLGLDYDAYSSIDNELRYDFQKRTNFMDDYFSKKIRKLKFETDGTFKMIAISPTEYKIKSTSVVPVNVLEVNLLFDRVRFEKIKNSNDCSYYLELLEEGFRKASKSKIIPLENLLDLIKEFKNGGCKNSWLHKKRKFKDEDLEVILTCEFTSKSFELIITINQISSKKELVQGVIIRTEVGVSIHETMYKDIIIDENIIITDNSNSPRIIVNKESVRKGTLKYQIIGDSEIRKILSFELLKNNGSVSD